MNITEREIKKGHFIQLLEECNWDWHGDLSIPSGRHSRRRLIDHFEDWLDQLQSEEGGRHFSWVRTYEKGPRGEDDTLRILIGGLRSRTREWEKRWSSNRHRSILRHYKKNNSLEILHYIVDVMDEDGKLDIKYELG